MVIFHKKNTRFDLVFPLIDGVTPRVFNTGESVTLVAWSQDGTGAWASLTIADTVSEIETSGIYEVTLTAAELNHDKVVIKLSGGATIVELTVKFDLAPNFANLTLGPTVLSS